MRDRLECPLRILDEDFGLQDRLDRRWREWCIENHQVDGEVPVLIPFDDLPPERRAEFSLQSLKSAPPEFFEPTLEGWLTFDYVDLENLEGLAWDAANVAGWYELANRSFFGTVGNFMAEVVGPTVRQKHYPYAGDRVAADLVRRSRTGESMLAFGITPEVVGMFARAQEAEVFDRLWGTPGATLVFDCLRLVGYAYGEPTTNVAIEWSVDGIHAYPISSAEYERDRDPAEIPVNILEGFAHATRLDASSSWLPEIPPGPIAPRSDEALRKAWPYQGQVTI